MRTLALRLFGSRVEARLVRFIVGIALVLMIGSTGYVSHRALEAFESEIVPGYDRQAEVVGRSIALQLARAIDLGIQPREFVEVEQYFAPIRQANPTFDYMVLADENGIELFASGNRVDLYRVARRDGRIDLSTARAAEAGRAREEAPGNVVSLERFSNTAIPIVVQGTVRAWLSIGVDRSEVAAITEATRWDILIVLLVSTLTAIELLAFLIDRSLKTPLRTVEDITGRVLAGDWTSVVRVRLRDDLGRFMAVLNGAVRRVNDHWQQLVWKAGEVRRVRPAIADRIDAILARARGNLRFAEGGLNVLKDESSPVNSRAPLFIFVFAEQLSTSFMPLYARMVYTPFFGLSEAVVIGLPIVVFVATLALVTPYGGALVGRFGARVVFLIGAVPAIVGYGLVSIAQSTPELMAYRALSGIGYAFITIACQGYLAESATPERRATVMANFVFAVMTGAVCGTAIGAVIADRIGYRATFLCAAVLVATAALFVWRNMDGGIGRKPPGQQEKLHKVLGVMRNRRFLALVLFAAVPAKIVLYGFIFYLVPLYLSSLDLNQPVIGRIMMVYGLTMLLTINLGAQLSDRFGLASAEIVWCGIVSGLGTLAIYLVPSPATAVLVAIALVGLCQGLSSAPLLTIVPAICPEESQKYGQAALFGLIRFAERVGSVLGPIIAALLVTSLGFENAIVAIGALSTVTALIFAVLARSGRTMTARLQGT
jgi:predicted MFS family arabinose efflux permease